MDMNQYLEMFIEEAREHLQAINSNLLKLEDDPNDVSVVDEVFRSAHTLKGMAATMGFEDMASLTHELENVLDKVRNEELQLDTDMMDVIFQSVDLLEGMTEDITAGGEGKANVSSVVESLTAILNGNFEAKQETAATREKPKPVEETDAEDMKRLVDQLDEFEATVIEQSKRSGHNVFGIRIRLSEECLLKSARAYMVFNALEESGEIIKSNPSVDDIEDEKFDLEFEIVYITKLTQEAVKNTILKLSEIEEVQLEKIEIKGVAKKSDASSEAKRDEPASAPPSKKVKQAEAKKPSAGGNVKAGKTIRVDIQRLDELMNLFSELVIDRGRLDQIARELGKTELMETVEHMKRISGDLQSIILNMRMVPVEQVFNRFPRMVRDLSKELNKKVNLEISGADTELDRTVIDEIGDPLVHMLRNSIDHGLESGEERIKAGKPEEGTIRLRAYHSGNHVFIVVEDDGKGIDKEKVIAKAVDRGVIDEESAHSLSDQQVYDLLFSSGFSTADKISDISGRGVGLDVVKTKIETLGGSVSIDSTEGKGTTFSIQLPLTLSIISAMLIEVQNEKYAIPLSSIIETAQYDNDEVKNVHGQKVIDFRGKVVPLVDLKEVFDVPSNDREERDETSVVIVRKGDKLAGLVVDSFIGQQEIVLKSLGNYLVNIFAISGATILGDGQVALILDCNALIR